MTAMTTAANVASRRPPRTRIGEVYRRIRCDRGIHITAPRATLLFRPDSCVRVRRLRGHGVRSWTMTDVSVSRDVPAPAERVWEMVSDLPRMGEWSPENEGGEWIGGATAAAPGAKFR